MASLDATVVHVGLPRIGDELGADVTSLQWVLTGYLVSLASLLLLGGAFGDRVGRRRAFVVGTVWFAGASVLCGAAPNIQILIAARILQGAGGALLTPASLAILQASFREADRARAVGAWSGLGAVAGALGPIVGGGLIGGPGWRWAFLINVPVAVLAVACATVAVPESRNEGTTRFVDVRGTAFAVAGVGSGTWAILEAGRKGWADWAVIVAATASAIILSTFVRHVRRTPGALVPPVLFRDRTFTVVNIGTAFLYGAIGLSFFLVSYELQVAAQWSALEAGVALLPTTVLVLMLSARSGAAAHRSGPRTQLGVGPLVSAAGLLALTRADAGATWAIDVLPGSVLLGLGLAAFVSPLTATVLGAAPPDHLTSPRPSTTPSPGPPRSLRWQSCLSSQACPRPARRRTSRAPTAPRS